MKKSIFTFILFSGLTFMSCSDEFKSPDQTDGFSNDKMEEMATNPEAAMFLNNAIESGVNNKFISWNNDGRERHDDFGQKAVDLGLDLMSNDMAMVKMTGWFSPYYEYIGRGEVYILTNNLWNYYTFIIDNLNTVIKNLENASADEPEVQALKGRAHGMRAFANFMLIRLYADGDRGIPYATESIMNYSRASTSEIESLIEKDLLLAYDLVLEDRNSKETLNKSVVAGLLSRYYLYKKDYTNVVKYADLALVNYSGPVNFDEVNDGFDKVSNRDWLWGKEITASNSTSFVSFFGHMDSYNPGGYVAFANEFKMIDKRLYELISETDKRKKWFSDGSDDYGIPKYANAFKFYNQSTDFTADVVYMRATEIFLNKAEAAAELGDTSTAQSIIEEIMESRDENYSFEDSSRSLMEEIHLQRRIELWGEGFAFFDMKRWGIGLNRIYEDSNHGQSGRLDYPSDSPKFVFQFPISEIEANDALSPSDQNPY